MATLGTSPEGFWSLTQGTRKQHTPKENKTTKHSFRKEEVQRLRLRGQYHCAALPGLCLPLLGVQGMKRKERGSQSPSVPLGSLSTD